MKTITVTASRNYQVRIGAGLLSNLGEQLLQVLQKPCKAVMISDSNVFPLYGEKVTESLEKAGFQVLSYVFPAGEASKNAGEYLKILNFLAEHHISRSDAVPFSPVIWTAACVSLLPMHTCPPLLPPLYAVHSRFSIGAFAATPQRMPC